MRLSTLSTPSVYLKSVTEDTPYCRHAVRAFAFNKRKTWNCAVTKPQWQGPSKGRASHCQSYNSFCFGETQAPVANGRCQEQIMLSASCQSGCSLCHILNTQQITCQSQNLMCVLHVFLPLVSFNTEEHPESLHCIYCHFK